MPDPAGATPATPLPVVAIIPAKDEAARIAATIRAVRRIPGIAAVVVVDDGSRDATAGIAAECAVEVVRHARNRGKADALTSGLGRMAALQHVGRVGAEAAALFVDADLEDSAEAVGALVEPVAAGAADLTIATLPRQRSAGGGRGLVVGLAGRGIEELTGWSPIQPLSGMRCLSPAAVAAALPFARGWGVEVGMTIDVLGAGLVVREIPCDLHHRVTGADWRAQLHRSAQYRDVALALGIRRLRRSRRS
ncbi:MAG TPA: glycosyltransferase [Intrasporangium sp.]|uniref:glycosyltransferase family 2 protein n=1 Tax=Intrasporangium sp. TaxID=1925024 RepID=UPI002B46F8D5|nr:glycosyltransferase [Intrasporangium sp.]HKX69400.1 glycosyltransferase [Intrasporangium sp.]